MRLLSSLDMMMFWVCAAVVWAEKLMRSGLYTSFFSLFNRKSWREGVRRTDRKSVVFTIKIEIKLSFYMHHRKTTTVKVFYTAHNVIACNNKSMRTTYIT